MINKIILIGNIGADAEEVITQAGSKYTKFTVATNERYTDPQGQWQTSTEWHTVKVWGGQAQNALQRCKRGKKIYVDGKLKSFKGQNDVKFWEIRCYTFRILDKDDREEVQVHHKPQSQFQTPSAFGVNQPAPSWGAPIK